MAKFQFKQSLAISVSIFLVSCAPGPVGTQANQPKVQQPTKQSPASTPALPSDKLIPTKKDGPLTPKSTALKDKLKVSPAPSKLDQPATDSKPEVNPDKSKLTTPTPEKETTAELIKKEESELTNLNIPTELDEAKANTLELGEQPDSASKDKIKNDIAKKLANNTHPKVKVTGQLELPATGFKTQQTAANLSNYVVQLYGPDGTLLAETTSDSEGKYSFANIPSGLRVEIVAYPPFAFSNRMTAIMDIPPATSPDQTIPSNVSSRSTALMKVVRSAKRRGNSKIDRVSVKDLEEKFKSEIDAVDEEMKLTLNQEVMEQFRNNPNDKVLLKTLRSGRSQQARAIRKAAQTFRKTVFEDSSLVSLDKDIITSPVVLRGSVTFDAVIVPEATNLQVVLRSTSKIEIMWNFAPVGKAHTYKVYLNGQLQAQDYTRHIFSFDGLSSDTEYIIELQTVTDSGESGKISLKASTTDQGSTGTLNFSGGGDTGSDANPVTTTTTTPTITSLAPTSGVVGTSVTITGADFDATTTNNTVLFDATSATVTAATSTALTVTVPNGVTGTVNVTVAVNGQTSAATTFTVSTPIDEFQVNTYTTDKQDTSSIAMDDNGNFVVVWQSEGAQDGNNTGVFAQRYNSVGVAQGSEFQVNTYTTNNQINADVAMDSSGNFVVVWESSNSQDGGDSGIYMQRYNSAGVAQGGETLVNTTTAEDQYYPAIAMDDDGDFVVVWSSYDQDGSYDGVYMQRYNAAGATQGGETQVNTFTTNHQREVDVAMDGDGDFVVVWRSFNQDGDNNGVYMQRYNAAGATQGGETQVNTTTANSQDNPSIAMDTNGNFVVVWESLNQDGSNEGIFAQRYNASGAAQGSEFQVNTITTNSQGEPALAMDSDGDFVISWHSQNQDGDSKGVYAQRYNSAGVAQGSEFQVNTYTTNAQEKVSIAMDSDGDFVIAWKSSNQDGDNNGIFAKGFDSSGVAQ